MCECYTATWAKRADTSNCRHKWLTTLEDDVVQAKDSLVLVGVLYDNLTDTVIRRTLVGGDIVGSVDLSTKLVTLSHIQIMTNMDANERNARATNFTTVRKIKMDGI